MYQYGIAIPYKSQIPYEMHCSYGFLGFKIIFGAELLMRYSLVICKMPWMNEFHLRFDFRHFHQMWVVSYLVGCFSGPPWLCVYAYEKWILIAC